jgi:hypothetical protein
MGYYSVLTGEIVIQPPLTARQIQRELPPKYHTDLSGDLKVEISTTVRDTGDGEVITRAGVLIVPASEDSGKYYNVSEELAEIIGLFPEHAFTGTLIRYGEDATDVERYYVRETPRRVISESARVIVRWPDGTEGTQRVL